MELLVFRHAAFLQRYNCALLSPERWEAERVPYPATGVTVIALGVFYLVFYVPVLFVMMRAKYLSLQCYVLMFFMGVQQVASLVAHSFVGGFFIIYGSVYCIHPYMNYIVGCLMGALWGSQCVTCAALACNRIFELWEIKLPYRVRQWKLIYWITVSLLYFVALFFIAPPAVYAAKGLMWYFNPYYGIDGLHDFESREYQNNYNTINTYGVITVITILYVLLVGTVFHKLKLLRSEETGKIKLSIVLQAIIICSLHYVTAFLFLYIQYNPSSPIPRILDLFVCQANYGAGGFVYLVCNHEIRSDVKSLFKARTVTVKRFSTSRC